MTDDDPKLEELLIGNAATEAEGPGTNAIAIGNYACSEGEGAIAIGAFAQAKGRSAIALGYRAYAEGDYAVAVGDGVQAVGNGKVVVRDGYPLLDHGTIEAIRDVMRSAFLPWAIQEQRALDQLERSEKKCH